MSDGKFDGRFQVGNPGRPKGAGRNVHKPAREWFAEQGFDWRAEAMKRFYDPNTPNASRDYCLGLIADRCDPKQKAVEVTGMGNTATHNVINIIAGEQAAPVVINGRTVPDLISGEETGFQDETSDEATPLLNGR